jgi:hypothetical protein
MREETSRMASQPDKASDRIHLATRKGVFTVERKGRGDWRVAHASLLGVNATMVLADSRDGSVYTALEHGHFGAKVHRSRDGGATWDEIATPAYPEKPADCDDVDNMRKTPLEWKLQKIWAFETGGDDEPGRLWAGSIPGGLFTSTDSGATWSLNRPLWDHPDRKSKWFGGGADLPGIHSICVDPRDSKRILAGVSCGGTWLTEDRGESWKQTAHGMRAEYVPPDQTYVPDSQDVHCVVQCRTSPDVYWAQHHNGIFRSTNNGTNWEEITENAKPSAFGFPVRVHPRDPDLAWFVPAQKDELRFPVDGKIVVSRTRDGGRTFEVITKGLPQEHAYDLVYRHGLDVDGSGDRLAFGSTTGSAWVSEDGGDSWSTISTHLPPIHCVRFS